MHGAVRITYPFSAVDARILRYWLLLALIGVVVLAGAAVVGLGLARFVTRPLRSLEEAAAAVGEGHLEARAPEREGPPEVRSLAAVFNETVAKLSRLLRSQGEFVADASHELRTPLTALRLRLESLPAESRPGRRAARGRSPARPGGRSAHAGAGGCRLPRAPRASMRRRSCASGSTCGCRSRTSTGHSRCRPRRPAAGARGAGTARAGDRQPHRQRARGVSAKAGR